ncbi:ADP-ribosylglycohydrolase [Salinihabitans flavidus]|uniref:ADP-ribosylglycohydrolase n=1 Tax=Salinihabitans flavidus TaxID=569882 RepID=A0A1H8SI85_9RHOB|nr:ADP-ribosylglycohydrolase family protein [Salinihabitans flavidus]SEO78719.1 ADP-ribosylglycohydrolase [Salinihabitans flavidus]
MIGAIAGDIAGSRFEGDSGPPEGFELFAPDCRFTDDTVCTLAVAEALMQGADFSTTLKHFVRRHPDRGYGGMFRQWAFSERTSGYGSWGNGAPMRVSAVGWLTKSAEDADHLAAAQAQVSHDHPDAVAAARAVARTILAFRQGASVGEVRDWLTGTFGYDLRAESALARGGFDVSAAGTVPVALAAAFVCESWEETVRTVIGLGGDTDTLACIAGAVAEARHGVPVDVADRAREYLTPDLREVLSRFEERVSKG